MDDAAKKISGGAIHEVKGGLVGGNIQIHPPHNGRPGVRCPLPAWAALEP